MAHPSVVVEFYAEGSVCISGDRPQLAALADFIAQERDGVIALPPTAPKTKGGTVADALRTVVVDGRPMSMARSRNELVITGDIPSLALLADNIRNFAHTPAWGRHIHVEHYSGHTQIGADSMPAIIEATTPAPGGSDLPTLPPPLDEG